MSNVIGFDGKPVSNTDDTPEVNLHLVEKLKVLLSKAESGELTSLVATGILGDRSRLAMFSCSSEFPYDLIGSVELLKQELIEFTRDLEGPDFDVVED